MGEEYGTQHRLVVYDFYLKAPIYRHKSKLFRSINSWKLIEIENQTKYKEAVRKKP